jgi:hypothetical protein
MHRFAISICMLASTANAAFPEQPYCTAVLAHKRGNSPLNRETDHSPCALLSVNSSVFKVEMPPHVAFVKKPDLTHCPATLHTFSLFSVHHDVSVSTLTLSSDSRLMYKQSDCWLHFSCGFAGAALCTTTVIALRCPPSTYNCMIIRSASEVDFPAT